MNLLLRNLIQLGCIAGLWWVAKEIPGPIPTFVGLGFGLLLGSEVARGLARGGDGAVRVGAGTRRFLPLFLGLLGALLGWI
ncbi:hypothetical protein H8D30_02340 [bacterium]|nr:hypothetical protein [bacterium]